MNFFSNGRKSELIITYMRKECVWFVSRRLVWRTQTFQNIRTLKYAFSTIKSEAKKKDNPAT